MPLFHITGSLFHFAHVPRCGGSAVENYLTGRFGPIALLDRRFLSIREPERWSRSSPQHLETEALYRLIPKAWIRGSFAIVRHPEDRIRSLFLFQRDIEGKIPADIDFEQWVSTIHDQRAQTPHWLDNHPRPMVDLVPEDAMVFRLENGLEPVIEWLDEIEGIRRAGRVVPMTNDYVARVASKGREPGPTPVVTAAAREELRELYAVDFERFGYVPRTGEDAEPAPSEAEDPRTETDEE